MRKCVIVLCAVLILVVLAFWIGRAVGVEAGSKLQAKRGLQLHRELVDLDKRFLTNVVSRPSTMISGLYQFEVRFAGKTGKVSEIELEFSNGQLVKASRLPIQGIVQTGNVVSWEQYEISEGPSAIFVGRIDGKEMWGQGLCGTRTGLAPGGASSVRCLEGASKILKLDRTLPSISEPSVGRKLLRLGTVALPNVR